MVSWAQLDAADDFVGAAVSIPLPWRLHVVYGVGYRQPKPLTLVSFGQAEYDLFRNEKHRWLVFSRLARLKREGHSLFDDRVWKQTFGIGYDRIVWSHIGVGARLAPLGTYHGTRYDNPEKGTPSGLYTAEFTLALFVHL